MKVVGIAGSLRPESNTLQYVKKCLGRLDELGLETELISLEAKEIKPCLGCYSCVKIGKCIQEDDAFAAILEKMRLAEGIVIGSPVYLSSATPQVMSLLSRATFVAIFYRKSRRPDHRCPPGRSQPGVFAAAALVFHQRYYGARFDILECRPRRHCRGTRRRPG